MLNSTEQKISTAHRRAQWLSGRVLDSRPKGRGFEPHRRQCVVVLEQHMYPSLVLVQPRKTRPCLTERLLMGHKESNQTNQLLIKTKILTNTEVSGFKSLRCCIYHAHNCSNANN